MFLLQGLTERKKLNMKQAKNQKMTMILSVLCVFLFVFHGKAEEKVIKEKDTVSIRCEKDHSGTIFWFHLKENMKDFEYIGSYSKTKNLGKVVDNNKFGLAEKQLEVKSFNQETDSGTYSCVLLNNNELHFSGTTRLRGEKVPTTTKPKVDATTTQTVAITAKAAETCTPNLKVTKSEKIAVLLGCEMIIFIPLVVGCGLLLLLLLITILYCNRIRTRRCPHHYKRQPRSRPAGHKTLPNPPDY